MTGQDRRFPHRAQGDEQESSPSSYETARCAMVGRPGLCARLVRPSSTSTIEHRGTVGGEQTLKLLFYKTSKRTHIGVSDAPSM